MAAAWPEWPHRYLARTQLDGRTVACVLTHDNVAGLLLAAGEGRRYGMPKALVEVDGSLWVERAVAALRDGGCDPVVVVLGAAAETVRHRARIANTTVIDNPEWRTGMGSSLRVGVSALKHVATDAVVVLPVDMPGVGAQAVRRVAALAAPDALAAASYHGERGHPVLLGRDHWRGVLESAVGDVGARGYLRAHPPRLVACDDVADGADIDSPQPRP